MISPNANKHVLFQSYITLVTLQQKLRPRSFMSRRFFLGLGITGSSLVTLLLHCMLWGDMTLHLLCPLPMADGDPPPFWFEFFRIIFEEFAWEGGIR